MERLPTTFYGPLQHAHRLPPNGYLDRPCILNEYAALWLDRDGTPTAATKPFYDAVLGPQATATQRWELYGRYLAALTEYWRSSRTCFGVLYPFGLNYSFPGGATSDNFVSVDELTFDPQFAKYVGDSFAALGVSIDAWDPIYPSRKKIDVPVLVTNDLERDISGKVLVAILAGDKPVVTGEAAWRVPATGQARVFVPIQTPAAGRYTMVATLIAPDRKPVKSYRDTTITERSDLHDSNNDPL